MLKGLAFACCLLASATSFAQRSSLAPSPISIIISAGSWMMQGTTRLYQVDVQAKGATFEIAKTDAFRLAVEQAVGTLLLSETEMQNGNITRRDVINYASGYVDRFEVLSRTDNPDNVQVTFRVWISHSQIANRLLGQSKDNGQFDGSRASAQISTLLQERQTGDRAVAVVLGDFPKRAFNIKVGKLELKFDERRNAVVEIPFLMSWSYDYLVSLSEILKKTSQAEYAQPCWRKDAVCKNPSYVRMNIQIPNKFFGSKNWLTYGFDEMDKVNLVKQSMIAKPFSVQVTVNDQSNQVILSQCYKWNQLGSFVYPYYDTTVVIDGFYVLNGSVPVNFGQRLNALESINNVDVVVVLDTQCKS
jgi:hypothetical protein